MQLSITIAAALSSVSFLLYGASLFGSRAMVAEFERYQLARYRTLTGALQMASFARPTMTPSFSARTAGLSTGSCV